MFSVKTNRCKKMALFIILFFFTQMTLAGTSGMPWEDPLEKLIKGLSGKTATLLAMGAFIGSAIGMMLRGGEMGPIVRTLLILIMMASMAIFANTFFTYIFGNSGALMGM